MLEMVEALSRGTEASSDFLTLDPGWKKSESGLRYKHPGSATIIKTTILLSECVWPPIFLMKTTPNRIGSIRYRYPFYRIRIKIENTGPNNLNMLGSRAKTND
jgi:hypothetical protein